MHVERNNRTFSADDNFCVPLNDKDEPKLDLYIGNVQDMQDRTCVFGLTRPEAQELIDLLQNALAAE